MLIKCYIPDRLVTYYRVSFNYLYALAFYTDTTCDNSRYFRAI